MSALNAPPDSNGKRFSYFRKYFGYQISNLFISQFTISQERAAPRLGMMIYSLPQRHVKQMPGEIYRDGADAARQRALQLFIYDPRADMFYFFSRYKRRTALERTLSGGNLFITMTNEKQKNAKAEAKVFTL